MSEIVLQRPVPPVITKKTRVVPQKVEQLAVKVETPVMVVDDKTAPVMVTQEKTTAEISTPSSGPKILSDEESRKYAYASSGFYSQLSGYEKLGFEVVECDGEFAVYIPFEFTEPKQENVTILDPVSAKSKYYEKLQEYKDIAEKLNKRGKFMSPAIYESHIEQMKEISRELVKLYPLMGEPTPEGIFL